MFSFILLAVAFAGCSLVDEDMTDCESEFTLDYELQLVTNMTTELQTELSMITDVSVSTALKTELSNIFTDFAHDVDLSFYDVQGDSLRLHHEKHIMDASQSSYTLYIPVRRYMHVGVANLEKNDVVGLKADEKCHSARLEQQVADTLSPHTTGIFTGRYPLDIKEGKDQEFDVRLYMANCATALVLDTLGSNVKDIRVYTVGFATDFNLADSTYLFRYTPVHRTKKVEIKDESAGKMCFLSVNFPSRRDEDTKVIIDTDDDDVVASGDVLWQYRIYSYLQDGTITETQISVHRPLLPAHLKLICAKVYGDGSLIPGDSSLTVSVTLDWDPGLEHEVIL